MSRIKTGFAVLVMAAMVTFVPSAYAAGPTVEVIAAGSSAMWQTLALAAWSCKAPATAPCFHYTNKSNFVVADIRPTLNGYTGSVNTDQNGFWLVWDSTPASKGGPRVWADIKVDSVVGDRCYLANPRCYVNDNSSSTTFPSASNSITFVWGADTTPPPTVQAMFEGIGAQGTQVNAAATDIRPEDAGFVVCRVNSALGQATGSPVNGFDGTDGLGYNSSNPAGTCAPTQANGATLANLVGTPIASAISGAPANVLAFNQPGGTDPFTNNAIPTATTISVGAAPIVFFYGNAGGQLTGLSNVTTAQLQTVFSGGNCDAGALGLSNAGIQVYQREPESGTMNTTEATVFRFPVNAPAHPTGLVYGTSQETNVGTANPLNPTNAPCPSSDSNGGRWRVIGTSQMVSSVQNSDGAGNTWGTKTDGIGYAFNGFGNFSALTNSSNTAPYGYVSVDGVDPIFATHTNNYLPYCSYPCTEAAIWGSVGTSYPNVRNGTYGAWSVLRIVTASSGATLTAVKDLVAASQDFVVSDVPDYVPAVAVAGDPGLLVWRSHYQQWDGTGTTIGAAPSNGGFGTSGNTTGADKGGDMGGCVLDTGKALKTITGYVQSAFGQVDTTPIVKKKPTGPCPQRVE